jgi:hypothetical protein
MLRAVLATAVLAGAVAKGVAIGVVLTTAGAVGAVGVVGARCACRSRRRRAGSEARPQTQPDAGAEATAVET